MQKITIFFFILMGITACRFLPNHLPDMQSNIVSTTRNLSKFQSINIQGAADVKIHKSSENHAVIDAESGIVANIITSVEDNVLFISQVEGTSTNCAITVHVFTDQVNQIMIDGAGSIEMLSDFTTDNFVIRHSGAGNVTLKGIVQNFDCNLSGSGDIDASELTCETVSMDLGGAGDVDICVKDKLDAQISGVGNIRYSGNPQITQEITGVGKVKQVDKNCH